MRLVKIFIAVVTLLAPVSALKAQVYNIATENGNTINTCVGAFTDSDAFQDDVYLNNEDYMVTFCSDQPGECLYIDFTEFDVPDPQDWLYIYDGADTASGTLIGQFNNPFGNNDNSLSVIYPDGLGSTSSCLTFLFVSDGDFITGSGWSAVLSCIDECPTCYDGIQNGAELDVDCGGVCEPCPEPINIADGGTVYTCGAEFVDSGGLTDEYSDGENHTVTICSDNPNPDYCIAALFLQFQLEFSGWGSPSDNLYVHDGPSTGSPLIGTYNGDNLPSGTILGSSECLTFRFESGNWATDDGWYATIECQPCAELPVPDISDCLGAIPLCSDYDTLATAPTGNGNYNDVLPMNNCNVNDWSSAYYIFDIETSGVLNFNINSQPLTNNYDFMLLNMTGLDCETLGDAPMVSCNGYSNPGADAGPTGISTAQGGLGSANTAIPYNEDVDVVAGQTYALVINSQNASAGFDIDFSSSTASIADVTAPVVTDVVANCSNNILTVSFSEQVVCSSISPLDFELVGAAGIIPVDSITAHWCSEGYEGSLEYTFYLADYMEELEPYVLSLGGSDGGIEDKCGNVNTLQSFSFTTSEALELILDITPSDCAESVPTGEVAIEVIGGVEPYYLEMDGQYLYDDSIFTFVNLPAGDLQLDVYDDNGCYAIYTIHVPTSNSNIDNDIVIENVSCVGGDGSIEVSTQGDVGYGPWNYTISDSTGTPIAISLNSDYIFMDSVGVGEYTITIEDMSGNSPCPDNQTVIVDVPDSIFTFTLPDTTICYFGEHELSGYIEGGTGSPFTLNWTDGVNQWSTNPNQTITVDSLTQTTTYTVYGEDQLGCTSIPEYLTVNVYEQLTFDMTPDTVICEGNTIWASVTNIQGGTGNGYEVVWDLGDNLIVIADSIFVDPQEAETYCVTVSDQCETPDVDSCITIYPTLYQPVTFDITSDTAACPPYLASFSNTTDPAIVAFSEWDFGDGHTSNGNVSANNIYTESGVYDVTLTVWDDEGCPFDTTYTHAITMYPEPEAEFSMSPEVASLAEPTVQFYNESQGFESSYWIFDTINNLGEAYIDDPFYSFPDQLPDIYFNKLEVTNEFGCTDHITKMLVVEEDLTLFVPNSFSPNGDGKNDEFFIKSRELDPVFYNISIYDRWGTLVYESNDINGRWNGSVNNGEYYAQPGVFVYNIVYKISESTEKVEIRGSITLLR